MSARFDSAATPFSPLIGVAPLMRCAFANEDLTAIGAILLKRAQDNEMDANAYLDCSTVLQLSGDRDVALAVQSKAIEINPLYSFLPQGEVSLKLLVIMGPGDLMANTPIEFLLENSNVSFDILYLTLYSDWPDVIPVHDVMMVAMAESQINQPLLARLASYISDWPRPVINFPERIATLSRDGVYSALNNIEHLDIPRTIRVSRSTLENFSHDASLLGALLPGDAFPVIVRPVGSHAGQSLEKISNAFDLKGYLSCVASEWFYLARFVDYRSADGLYRKYRIALIDGRPFVCHFAVSSNWMVHYLNAGMSESAEKRAEEAEVMAQFDQQFAQRHAGALTSINKRMGLQYLGIDCAETLSGELLIFEVDNAMVVHAMDPVALYPYKKPAMDKVFIAFRSLLEHTAQSFNGQKN
jgi:hypothetical protein